MIAAFRLTPLVLAVVLLSSLSGAFAAEQRLIPLTGDIEAPIAVHPASGDRLLLWLPSEHGLPDPVAGVAEGLAGQGIEVWEADLLEAHFLPVQASSLAEVPAADVVALIEAARETGKQVYVAASDHGAVLALEGTRAWQQAHPDEALGGAVLISPNLYTSTPEPGETARYLPIARATNLPVYVLQPERSPWRWRLEQLYTRLSEGGASVFLHQLPGVRDRFHFRPDGDPAEARRSEQLPRLLARSLPLLDRVGGVRAVAPLPEPEVQTGVAETREKTLRPYEGDPAPPELALPTLQGEALDLEDRQGEVILINFWASWCPPCVYEMPSMERLEEHFTDEDFRILAVNMGEDEDTIRTFLREKVDVSFTILLDEDGAALKRWRVFAFPTSYLLDRRGRIRYALFGATEWDTPAVYEIVERLLAEEAS